MDAEEPEEWDDDGEASSDEDGCGGVSIYLKVVFSVFFLEGRV